MDGGSSGESSTSRVAWYEWDGVKDEGKGSKGDPPGAQTPNSHDQAANSRLAAAVAKAKEGGVPRSVIESCFARAKAVSDGSGQSVTYEAVGPGGKEAMMIECLTENPARTVQRVKEILHKNGCRVAPVAYLFDKKGLIQISPTAATEAGTTFDDLFDLAVEAGAEDVREVESDQSDNEVLWEIITPPTSLSGLTHILTSPPHSGSYILQSSELAFVPQDPLPIGVDEEGGVSEERAESVAKVVDLLEGEGEVVRVWTNLAE
ncbi:hypothetical protein EHS25_003071 [Saitozyma podzolica]|uniref:TACO1/YebC-like second and third domain-containing protein n=1 Tax=Saitozyma podzolica TaxID=1890683 RepID=A0A427YCQ5_9TREE|nr:hypothetical protein EHS25_003071 [Saitozyma podzolica]